MPNIFSLLRAALSRAVLSRAAVSGVASLALVLASFAADSLAGNSSSSAGALLSTSNATPDNAFLSASRAASVIVNYKGLSSTYTLSDAATAPDGGTWYGSARAFFDTDTRLTATLTGYLTSWYTYAQEPTSIRETGPVHMTQLLSSTNLLHVTTAITNLLYRRFGTTSTTDFYARFTPITYKLKYNLGSGAFPEGSLHPETATYDVSFTVSAPVRDFYSFAGWKVGKKTYFNGVSNDVTFVNLTAEQGAEVEIGAMWKANQYPLELSLKEGVAKIHYRVSDASDWLETTEALSVPVDYGETWSAWAEAAYGWEGSGSGWSEKGVTSGRMTEAGDQFGPEAKRKSFTVTAKPSPATGGAVTGSGSYEYESQIELTATPATGHSFAGWSDGEASSVRTLKVVASTNLTANFTRNTYHLTLKFGEGISNIWYRLGTTGEFTSVTDTCKIAVLYGTNYACYATTTYGWSISGIGSSEENLWSGTMPANDLTFEPSPQKNVYRVQLGRSPAEGGSVSGAGDYEYLAIAYLTASPSDGYAFANWSDGSIENPYWYPVVSNAALVATFAPKAYALQLVVGEGVAKIFYQFASGDDDWPEAFEETDVSKTVNVPYGTRYRLYAEAKTGYVMSGSGSSVGSAVTGTIRTGGAVFEPKPTKEQYRVTLSANPTGAGTVSGGGTYGYGATATVQAVPNEGYEFAAWSDGSAETPHAVTVLSATNLVATFAPKTYTLQLVVGEGVEKIFYRLASGDDDWPETFEETDVSTTVSVRYGTRYQLYATAKPGYVLSGTGSSAGSAVTGTIRTGGAVFEPKPTKEQYRVTLSAKPTGAGTVSGSGSYGYGETATVQAVPNDGYEFVSWSDGSTETPHAVTVLSATNLVATFKGKTYTLQLVVGEGVAKIFYRLAAGDDDWPETFSETDVSKTVGVAYGVRYQLYAEAKAGYVMSGTGSSAGSAVTGTMKTNGVIFEPKPTKAQYRVTVTSTPVGAGTVSGGGTYGYGETASVVAAPEDGYRFDRWSDGSTETPHAVTVLSATNLVATFAAKAYALQLIVGEGVAKIFYQLGDGAVAETAGSMTLDVAYGTHYRLWAETLPGYALSGSGSSAGAAVTGTMKTDGFVFEPKPTKKSYLVTVTPSPTEAGTCTVNGDGTFEAGARAKVTATAKDGWVFVRWDDVTTAETKSVSWNPTYDFTVNADTVLNAVFAKETCVVTFVYKDATGADIREEQDVAYGASAVEPPAEKRNNWPGHTFTQWDSSAWKSVKGDCTITAQYTDGGYTVHFNANGGTGTMSDQSFTFGKEQALRKCTFTRTGYTFAGWTMDATILSCDFTDEQVVKDITTGSAITLYAVWEPITYTIRYTRGAAEKGEPFERRVKYDAEHTIETCPFEGPTSFSAWYDLSSHLTYAAGEKVSRLTSEQDGLVTLEARYATGSQVKFHANYSAETVTQFFEKDVEDALRANTFTRPGYTFAGWFDASTLPSSTPATYSTNVYLTSFGTITNITVTPATTVTVELIADQSLLTNPADPGKTLDLYAIWQPNTYQVVFDANGEKDNGKMPPMIFINSVAREVVNKFDSSRTFLGWGLTKTNVLFAADKVGNATLLIDNSITTIPGDHIRLYAIWQGGGMKATGMWSSALGCENLEFTERAPQESIDVPKYWKNPEEVYTNSYLAFGGSKNTEMLSSTISENNTLSFFWRPSEDEEASLGVSVYNGEIWTNGVSVGSTMVFKPLNTGWHFVTLDVTTNSAGNSSLSYVCVDPHASVSISNVVWGGTSGGVTARFDVPPEQGAWLGGGALEQTLTSGGTPLEPTVVGTNGWEFAGWRRDEGVASTVDVKPDEMWKEKITADTTYVAVFEPHPYSVTYANMREHNNPNNPGTFVSTNGVLTLNVAGGPRSVADAYAYAPLKRINAGDDDNAWSPSNLVAGVYGWRDASTGFFTYTNAVTRAEWYDEKPQETNWFTVTFVSGEDDSVRETRTVEKGKGVTDVPDAAAKNGYAFTGWDKSLDNVKEDFETKAQYALVRYPIAYSNLKGATHANPSEYDITSFRDAQENWCDLSLEDPKTDNRNISFLGWDLTDATGETVRIGRSIPLARTNALSSIGLSAVWAYSVTYTRTPGDGIEAIEGQREATARKATVYVEETLGATNAASVTCLPGYAFVGWRVTYPVDAESLRVLADDEGFLIDAAGDRVVEGSVITNVSGAMELAAVATACVYRVTYRGLEDATNNPANPSAYTVTNDVVFAEPGARVGWRFAGWEPAEIAQGTTGDVTVVASWTQQELAVTIDGVATNVTYGTKLFYETFANATNGLTNVVCRGWVGTGDVPASGSSNGVSFTVTQASTLAWRYATNYWVSVSASTDAEHVDATPSSRQSEEGGSVALYDAASCPVANPEWYAEGTNLVAEATPAAGWAFARWEGAMPVDATPSSRQTTDATPLRVHVSGPVALTAVFTQKVYTVTFELDENLVHVGGGELVQSVAHGESATLPTVESIGYNEFDGWYDAEGCPVDAETLRVITASATYYARCVSAEPYISATVDEEYETKVAIDPIEVRCIHEEAATLKVTGLPTGLKFTTKLVTTKKTSKVDGKKVTTVVTNALPNTIYGTPTKSGLYTATATASVTKKVKKQKVTTVVAKTNLAFVVRAAGETVVRTEVVLAEEESSGVVPGKATGQGVYAAGKKATLKATANKGYVFSGWYSDGAMADDDGRLLSRAASYALVVPEEDTVCEARFVTSATDAASIRASVNGMELISAGGDDASASAGKTVETNVTVGVSLAWPVAYDAVSASTVAVSGLPKGLKFTAKPIVTKTVTKVEGKSVTTVVTNVPANTIYGIPTVASTTDRKGQVVPSKVKVTVTTAGKNKVTGVIVLTVEALPTELVGTYVGGTDGETGEEDDLSASAGAATVTLGKTGKVSGKWVSEGKTWTLAASGFDAIADGGLAEAALSAEGCVYWATNVTFTCGKKTERHSLAFSIGELGYGRVAAYREADGGDALFSATYVPWTTDATLKKYAKQMKGKKFSVTPEEGATLTGTVGANGAVSVKGSFDVGAKKPYAATVSSTLVPLDEELTRFELFVYYAPKSSAGFAGYATTLCLLWDGEDFDIIR